MNVFIFLIDPLSPSLSHVSLLCPWLAPSRSKAFDFFLSLSRCHYCVERKPARNFIALARKGAALVRTYVPGHVGTEPRPLCPLWLFRARERDTTLWARGLFRPGRMEDKNVSENKLTLLGSPVIGFWGQEIVCYRGTCRPCILFLFFFYARVLHTVFIFFLLLLSLLFSSIEMYKNERI